MRAPGEPRNIAYLYLAPAFLFLATFVLYPVALTAYYSLLDWDGLTAPTFVGLQNYARLATDTLVLLSLRNAGVLLIFYTVLPVAIGLVVAAVLATRPGTIMRVSRTLLFLPQVIAPVVVAVGWRLILDANHGLLNGALDVAGLSDVGRPWLGDFGLALPSVGVVATWTVYGLMMVLFLAGIQRIPSELYDAVRVDGAGPIREFFTITLPAIRGEVVVGVVVTFISAFRNFDLVFNLTRGGPGNATVVPVLEVYRRAFLDGRVGSGAALGLSIAMIVLLLTLIVMRVSRGKQA